MGAQPPPPAPAGAWRGALPDRCLPCPHPVCHGHGKPCQKADPGNPWGHEELKHGNAASSAWSRGQGPGPEAPRGGWHIHSSVMGTEDLLPCQLLPDPRLKQGNYYSCLIWEGESQALMEGHQGRSILLTAKLCGPQGCSMLGRSLDPLLPPAHPVHPHSIPGLIQLSWSSQRGSSHPKKSSEAQSDASGTAGKPPGMHGMWHVPRTLFPAQRGRGTGLVGAAAASPVVRAEVPADSPARWQRPGEMQPPGTSPALCRQSGAAPGLDAAAAASAHAA